MTAFETGTGLYTAGSLWTKVMVLVCAGAIAGAFGLLWGLQRFAYFPTKTCEDTFQGTTPLAPYVVIAISALSVLGGVVLYVTAGGESNSFLLVIPCDRQTVHVGDKVLLGIGAEITTREAWAAFVPVKVPGLCVVKYVDPKYWRGEMVHIEAGG